jgi:thiamine-phosphate pyrophosphorylase
LIQLRAKNSSKDEIRRMAEAILPVTRKAGVGLVINDHPDITAEVGAEFCHLGQEDFFDVGYKQVSELVGRIESNVRPHPQEREEQPPPLNRLKPQSAKTNVKIGLSTHAPAEAERALAAGPDYIAIGPVYATGTKPVAKPVTLEYVHWAAANVKIPWFAIGGINLGTLDEVLAAGARRICVVSAILNAPDIVKACREFKRRLG